MYKNLINLRLENPQIGRGWYCYREALNDKTVTYTREQPDLTTGFLVMINMKEKSLDLSGVSEDFKKNCGSHEGSKGEIRGIPYYMELNAPSAKYPQ